MTEPTTQQLDDGIVATPVTVRAEHQFTLTGCPATLRPFGRLLILPDQAVFRVVDGVVHSVELTGHRMKKDGSPGVERSAARFYFGGSPIHDNAPAWLRALARELAIGTVQ